MNFLLVHSPFLGPATWFRLRGVLVGLGHEVTTPDLRPGLIAGRAAYEEMSRLAAAGALPDPIVVLHSGAGGLGPSIWEASKAQPRCIFLDALLPHPGLSWMQTIDPAMAEHLWRATRDDYLPRWPDWVPPGTLDRLIPDQQTRTVIVSEAVAVPLAYVETKAPLVAGWNTPANSYAQLSSAYEAEAKRAAALGMVVRSLTGTHFSMVNEPEKVADLLIACT